MWKDGQIVDVNNHPLSRVGADTQVHLWHPLGFDVDTVLAWRNYLEQNQITQPFKQAYREVYILTDAEINTLSYSNRFAAHILKQHQFAAICKERGWVYHLQGDFNSYNRPTLSIPKANLRVEFSVEAVTKQTPIRVAFTSILRPIRSVSTTWKEANLSTSPKSRRSIFQKLCGMLSHSLAFAALGMTQPGWIMAKTP